MSAKYTYEDLERQIKELRIQNDLLRAQYGSIVDNSMDAILLTAPDGQVLFANNAACELFQMTAQEIVAGGRSAVVDAADPNLSAAIAERERNGKFIGEINLKKKDGTIFPGEVFSSFFRDTEGRILTSMIIRDLTERKRAQEFCRKFQNIVSSTPDGIAFLDMNYRYIIVNDAYEKFSDIPRERFVGKTVAEYLGADVFEKIIKPSFDRCLKGEVINYEGWFDYPTAGRRYMDITYYPYRDDNYRICGVIANTRDITERIQAEQALKEFEERQRQIIENSHAGYFLIDRQGRFQQVNSAWLKMHKYETADEIIGQHFSLTQVDGELQQARQIVARLLSGKEILSGEFPRKCKDNTVGYHTFTASPVMRQGEIIGLEGFLIDVSERKQAEEALKKSEAQYRLMFEKMMNGFALHEMLTNEAGEPVDYIFVEVNSAFERLTGLKRKEIIGKKVTEALPGIDKDPADWIGRYAKVALDGQESRFEQYADVLGKWFSVLAFSPQKGQFATIFEDVTKRKLAEEALRQSEARLSDSNQIMDAVMNHTHLLAALLDPKFNFIWVNRAYAASCGLEPSFFPGKNHFDLYPHAENQTIFQRVVDTGESFFAEAEPFEFSDQPERGMTCWDWSLIPEKDRTGKVTGLVFSLAEVTGRIRAEEALRKSETKYRSMMESMTDPVYICSPQYTVQYMNPAMIRRTGWDAVGEKCHRVLHDLDTKCKWCVFDKVAAGEPYETTIISPKDNRNYRVTNMPIHNEDGSISKMTIFRDITEYVRAVEEREKVKAQLIQSQKMESIGNLAGGIAHDFNNILSAIIGYTELALDDVEKGSQLEDSLQEVFTAGNRAKDLIKQILAFARQSDEERKPIRVATIAKEVLKLIRSTIPTTIDIRQIIESNSLIMGNSTQVNQIFMNLCTNAAHAMENAGGILEITLKDVIVDKSNAPSLAGLKPGNYIQIKVSDTGDGIPADIIDSIFEPYFSTKKPGEGTGLGLAIVHGIVESYGGRITVESEVDFGTVLTIHLPITGDRDDHRQYEAAELPSGNERILLVDDEAAIVGMVSRILNRLGYDVTVRTSSVEALELFRSKPMAFDLILTDMTMPNMTGDRLATEMMKIRPDIPVVLCTGFSNRISENSAANIGIKAFAFKPVTKADLANTIRTVLDANKTKRCE